MNQSGSSDESVVQQAERLLRSTEEMARVLLGQADDIERAGAESGDPQSRALCTEQAEDLRALAQRRVAQAARFHAAVTAK